MIKDNKKLLLTKTSKLRSTCYVYCWHTNLNYYFQARHDFSQNQVLLDRRKSEFPTTARFYSFGERYSRTSRISCNDRGAALEGKEVDFYEYDQSRASRRQRG